MLGERDIPSLDGGMDRFVLAAYRDKSAVRARRRGAASMENAVQGGECVGQASGRRVDELNCPDSGGGCQM